MILDFNPAQRLFTLKVPASQGADIMVEYGLDMSSSASTAEEAVLFTPEPYAAVTFADHATERARTELSYIINQIERSWAPSSARHIDFPQEIRDSGRAPWPVQLASADYALTAFDRGQTGVLIGDEPGIGKTITAVLIANDLKASHVLVVCPASIRFQWQRRIREWTTIADDSQVILASNKGVGIGVGHELATWTVISWDLVWRGGIWRALAKGHYDLLILDEAHYAKTYDAKRTRAIFGGGDTFVAEPLAKRASRVLALTGTPLPNRPREAYTLARGLCWEAIDFMSEDKFGARYNPIKTGWAPGGYWKSEQVGRTAELQNRLRSNFMVRHLKRDVMPQLKLPIFDLIRVEETRAVKAALAYERLLDIDPETFEGADADVLGHIAVARRQMGVAMAPQVASYLRMLVEGGEEKLTVFAWHIEVLDILCAELDKFGVIRVDGRDSAQAKDRKVREFIRDPGKRLIMGNVLSLGTGTDGLQEVCSHALLAEADWVHGNNVQCFDRLDRGGQKAQVQGDIFVAPGSIAEKILASALRKAQVVERTLDRRLV